MGYEAIRKHCIQIGKEKAALMYPDKHRQTLAAIRLANEEFYKMVTP